MTMKLGFAHSGGKYTWPTLSGTQFMDGCNSIYNAGFRSLKIYCTPDYLTKNYPGETAFSSTPTTCKQLLQTTEFATGLAIGWDQVIITMFTFANGTTNWWRAQPTSAAFVNEYNEIKAACEHLLSTYNGTGRTFIIQNWEGDWAYMDSFTVNTYVPSEMADRYAAFLGARQRAVEDARKSTASDCTMLNAIEVNRVVDSRLYPHRRRILNDIAKRVKPDIVSYSSYDSTIVDQGGWGADYATWLANTTPVFTKALRVIAAAWPGIPIQIGEFGYPEGSEKPVGRSIGDMVTATCAIAAAANVKTTIYWVVFDNEETSPGVPRGYYLIKPDGSTSAAGTALIALL